VTAVTVFNDFAHIPSFWIAGFEALRRQRQLRVRYAPGARCPVGNELKKWKSVVFTVRDGGSERVAVVDTFDNYASLNRTVLERVDVYFKFNYNPEHIRAELPPDLAAKIQPTGFYFPIWGEFPFQVPAGYVDRARAGLLARRSASARQRVGDALHLVRDLRMASRKFSTLRRYTHELAALPTDRSDLFWNVNYWGTTVTDGKETGLERLAVMKILDRIRKTTKYRLEFGFMDTPAARKECPEFILSPTPSTREYLEVLARSKMSLVSRGLSDCFSWRMGEHLALRRFTLMERPLNTSRVPLEDGRHAVFFETDLSDLEEKIRYYLEHDEERERIARQGREYFDRYCTPEIQIAGMVDLVKSGAAPQPAAAGRA
jgi:hypothetical protein